MYLFERFGSIFLPEGNMTAGMTPVSARVSFVETTDGSFDSDGTGRNRQSLPHSLRYQGVIPVHYGETFTTLRTLEDSLRAAVGTRAKLYRRARNDETVHWCYARLAGMPYDTDSKEKSWRNISLDFQQLTRWHGVRHDDPWTFDSGEIFDDALIFDEEVPTVLDSNPKTTVVANNGNIPIRDAQIIVTAAGSNITVVSFVATNINLTWTGTLLAGQALAINDSAASVLNNGANGYTGLVRNSGHAIENWFEFPPGNTNLVVTRNGGSAASTIAIIFRDGWA